MTLKLVSGLTLTKERSQVNIDGPSRRDFIKQTGLAALIAGEISPGEWMARVRQAERARRAAA